MSNILSASQAGARPTVSVEHLQPPSGEVSLTYAFAVGVIFEFKADALYFPVELRIAPEEIEVIDYQLTHIGKCLGTVILPSHITTNEGYVTFRHVNYFID